MGTQRSVFKGFAAILAATAVVLAGLALAALAPSAARADYVVAKQLFGGGAIAASAPQGTYGEAAQGVAIGLNHHDGSGSMGVRVAFALGCAGRTAEVVTRAAVAGDGSFHLHGKRLKTRAVGRVTLDLDGTIGKVRADGTVRIRTRYPCGKEVRAWSARGIDSFQVPPTTPAPVDGVFYGVTDQDLAQNGTPHGVVAKVDGGGTSIHLFTSWTLRCSGRDRKGAYRSKLLFQGLLPDSPLGPTGFRRQLTDHETASQRRKHIDFAAVTVYQGGFRGNALFGTVTDVFRYAEPGDRYRCRTGANAFSAVP